MHLAGADGQVESVDGGEVIEPLHEPLDVDSVVLWHAIVLIRVIHERAFDCRQQGIGDRACQNAILVIGER